MASQEVTPARTDAGELEDVCFVLHDSISNDVVVWVARVTRIFAFVFLSPLLLNVVSLGCGNFSPYIFANTTGGVVFDTTSRRSQEKSLLPHLHHYARLSRFCFPILSDLG